MSAAFRSALSRRVLAATLSSLAAGAAVAQAPALRLDPELPGLAQQEAPRLLDTLRQLTAIDSGTGQAPGMSAMADFVERFAKGMGGEVERITPASNVAGPNVVATFRGKGQKKVMLLAHMDTVYPAGTAAARPFRIEGNRAIAPGIADDKSGVAVFLHAVKLLQARGYQGCERITMVFNTDEERGSAGSRDLIRSRAGQHDLVLSGEPTSSEREGIVLGTSGVGQLSARLRVGGPFASADGRPIEELADLVLRSRDVQSQVEGTRMNWTLLRAEDPKGLEAPAGSVASTLTFRVRGRASHAGVAPQQGVNAIVELSSLVQRVTEAAATLPGARLHWRVAAGGLVGNIIPDRAQGVAELVLPAGADAAAARAALAQAAGRVALPGAVVESEAADGLTFRAAGAGEGVVSADQRVPNADAHAALGRAARALIEKRKFASSSITVQDGLGFPAYNASDEGRRAAETVRAIDVALGGDLALVPRTYGGTDAAWAAQSGKPVVENLGLPGGNYHSSDEEFVLVDRIPRRLTLAAEAIRQHCGAP
jgi:glutamate carboxypeptidase